MVDRRQLLKIFAGFATGASAARAADIRPKEILLIRHAEKTGDKADADLNPKGYQRAAALTRLFPGQFASPQFIFASARSAHSNRPVETVTPLSRAMKLQVNTRFANEAFAGLARELLTQPKYRGRIVLVCWHHTNIPPLAKALGVTNVPGKWPDQQFDHVWRLRYAEGTVEIADLPQRLLDGDS
jgi:phosphohistidine phosphatase SixA